MNPVAFGRTFAGMWNQRYDRPDYLFGTEPAAFVAEQAAILEPNSHVLCVADGEGRNSVYLAGLGHEVTAFDASDVALEKAQELARDRGVSVDFRHASMDEWPWGDPQYDAVVAVFIQFLGPDARAGAFEQMKRSIRPGGLMLLHGYAPRQVEYGTGGPPLVENMYTLPMLEEAFAGYEVLRAEDYDREIDEGPGHSGLSGLVDFIVQKPA